MKKLFLVITFLYLASTAFSQSKCVKRGDMPQYKFLKPLTNGMGVSSLKDFLGKPVLIEFYNTTSEYCTIQSVPAALKLAKIYKDDLAVILIERAKLSRDESEAFAINQKWMGNTVMWTKEWPFELELNVLPNFVLLSCEGVVLMTGNAVYKARAIEKRIKVEVEKRKKGPKNTPKAIRKLWSEFSKGKYTKAFKGLAKIVEGNGADADAATQTLKKFKSRLKSQISCTKNMIREGFYLEAEAKIKTLLNSIKGMKEYESILKELEFEMSSPDLVLEIDAAKAYAKIKKKIYSIGLKPGVKLTLKKFIEQYRTTIAANNAKRLLLMIK